MSDIFISYAREDKERIELLAKALEDCGWSVWWDQFIATGARFDDAIEKALAEAKCIIVAWSSNSISSRYVRAEAGEGAERQILLPVMIEEVSIPLAFRQIQTACLIDWQGSPQHSGFIKLVNDISSLLGQAPELPSKNPTRLKVPPRVSLVVAVGMLMIIMISIRLWRYNEKHDIAQPPNSSATPPTDHKIPYKVSYPMVNGQWTYPGWDPKRFNERPLEEQEALEDSAKLFTTKNQTEQGLRNGQWHAIHLTIKFTRPSEVRLEIPKDGMLSCSSCHKSGYMGANVDRIFPRTTCGKCHVME